MSLKLVRRQGSEHWYIRGTVRGQSAFETTGTDNQEIAEAIRIKRENELLERSVFGAPSTTTFPKAALSYLEDGGEGRFLGKFDKATGRWTLLIGHFEHTPIGKIGQAEIDAAAKVVYPTASPATRKRQVYAPMSAVLHHAARKGWAPVPRIRSPKVAPPVTKWSTLERLETLLPHCSPKLRRLVLFLVYTGARISEVLRVEWERDVSLARRTAILRRTKNGKMRTVHLPDPLLIALAGVPEKERKGKVFKWHARAAVYGPLRRACERAGVEYLPPHQQGRHTFASWLRTYAQRDLRGLMEDGGWENVQSVMRYAHVIPGETAKAVDQMPSVHGASTEFAPIAKRKQSKA
jgi:integrase